MFETNAPFMKRRRRKPINLGRPMVSIRTEDKLKDIEMRKVIAKAAAAELLSDEDYDILAEEARRNTEDE